jgi:hypothetical protein
VLGGAGLEIEDFTLDSLALASFWLVLAGVSGAVVVGVVAAPAAPVAPPSEITCAGGAFADPELARPINTPTPIASNSTPTPAINATLLLRDGEDTPTTPGGLCGVSGVGGASDACRDLSLPDPPDNGPLTCGRGSPQCRQYR